MAKAKVRGHRGRMPQWGTSKGLIQGEGNLWHMPYMNVHFEEKELHFFRVVFKNLIKTVKKPHRFIWKNITTHLFKCPREVKLRAEEDLGQMAMGNMCPANFLGILRAGCRPYFPLIFQISTSCTLSSSQEQPVSFYILEPSPSPSKPSLQ